MTNRDTSEGDAQSDADLQRSDVRNLSSRRMILTAVGAAGLTGLAGCGGDGAGGNGTGNGNGNGNGNGTSGGNGNGSGDAETFIFSDIESPSGLDPHAFNPSVTSNAFCFPEHGYETLLYFDPDTGTEVTPELATEVPTKDNGLVSEDGSTIEFPLREGVTFHDGEEMTAEDVRFSWERVMTLGIMPGNESMATSIDSMEAVDDYTFRVTLADANAPVFLSSTVTHPSAFVISRQAVMDNGEEPQEGQPSSWLQENSAGTGPYKLGTMNSTHVVWEPHTEYWDADNVNVKRVDQQFYGDLSTRLSMLQEGEAHFGAVQTADIEQLRSMSGVKNTSGTQISPTTITFNYDIPYDQIQDIAGGDTVPSDFFQDIHVRKAFAYAWDYEGFIEDGLNGFAARMNNVHMPGTLGYDDDAPIYNHDPEQAEEHFREAGYWEDGFEITLYHEQLAEFNRGGLQFKNNLESLNDNITINIVSEPEGQAVERYSSDPVTFPFAFLALLPIGPDPSLYYQYWLTQEGSMGGRTSFETAISEDIPELVNESLTTTNQDDRIEIFEELQQRCYEEVPVMAMHVPRNVFTTQECVETAWNPVWRQPHFSHFNIDSC